MDPQFIAILQKLIAEQGKDALLTKGKSFLGDYTGTEYKKERRLFVQALEAGAGKALDRAGDLETCKKQQLRLLHEDYFLDQHIAADVIDTLALVLRGDTAKTAPAPQTVPAAPPQKRRCRNCGRELEPAWKTCPYCEVPVTPQPVPVMIHPAAPPPVNLPLSQNMVRIQGGTFLMGSPAGGLFRKGKEAERNDDEVQHRVTVSSFYMGKYELTQKEWVELMGTNPSRFKGDNLPVECVSWYDAVNYCNARSMKEGLNPAYTINGQTVTWDRSANGYRLPTEAEWEYACRAGTTTPFNTGNNITTDQANYDGNRPYNGNAKGIYRKKTTEVGSFAPNPWGLYDMHGNVWEWCWDWYGDYASGSQTDPSGASSGSNRVIRGGCWGNLGQNLRSAERYNYGPSLRSFNVGFRVLRPSV